MPAPSWPTRKLADGWFGEGEIKFFIDGDTRFPTICGTGTEDYFCGTYGFPQLYTTAYVGNTLKDEGKNGPPQVEPLPLAHPGPPSSSRTTCG